LLSAACLGLPPRYRTNLGLFHDAPVIHQLLIACGYCDGIHLSTMAQSSCHRSITLQTRVVWYVGYELCQSQENILADLAIIKIQPIVSNANGLSKVVEDLTSTCKILIRRGFLSSYAQTCNLPSSHLIRWRRHPYLNAVLSIKVESQPSAHIHQTVPSVSSFLCPSISMLSSFGRGEVPPFCRQHNPARQRRSERLHLDE
jgi:hypothetical protein